MRFLDFLQKKILILLCLAQLPFCSLSADFSFSDLHLCPSIPKIRNCSLLSLGPEYYYLERSREGGSFQAGSIFGVRASYDRIKRYKFYFGVQGLYASGVLNGHGAKHNDGGERAELRSFWTDEMIESYLGYTFGCKDSSHFLFTPYLGYGYFREINQFRSPSPLLVKFSTLFGYFAYGFLSSIVVNDQWKVGLNARFRQPHDVKCHVSHDPEINNWDQIVGDSFQYRVELPFIYNPHYERHSIEFQFTLFYEQRDYGGWMNYPCDFPRTVIELYGVNALLLYRF